MCDVYDDGLLIYSPLPVFHSFLLLFEYRYGTRYFGRAGHLQSTDWVPHTTAVASGAAAKLIFASEWPLQVGTEGGTEGGTETLWTIVNRGQSDVTGVVLQIPLPLQTVAAEPHPHKSSQKSHKWQKTQATNRTYTFYDCYTGVRLKPVYTYEYEYRSSIPAVSVSNDSIINHRNTSTSNTSTSTAIGIGIGSVVSLSFTVEKGGFGCVVATPNATATLSAAFTALLATMASYSRKRLDSYSKDWVGM